MGVLLRDVCQGTCFMQLMEGKKVTKTKEPVTLPPTLLQVAARAIGLAEEEALQTVSDFKYSNEERAAIEEETKDQAQSENWENFKKGMMTASTIKSSVTRMETIRAKPEEDPSTRISYIMGYKKIRDTKAMKYGRAQESHAKRAYRKHMTRLHKNFKIFNCGLYIHPDHAHIGASPDLRVDCRCHGPGLCEIKCPISIKGQKPNLSNVSFLEKTGRLKANHQYSYQVQTQMAVTGMAYCDLFVYSSAGYLIERIERDDLLWQNILESATEFWRRFVVPELLYGKINKQYVLDDEDENEDSSVDKHEDHSYVLQPSTSKASYKPSAVHDLPVYICSVCTEGITDIDNAVQCNMCKIFSHSECVQRPSERWLCVSCDL